MGNPSPFLEVVVHRVDPVPGLTGFCAGYEQGQWRCSRLAGHLMEWLPNFALPRSERKKLGDHNVVAMLRRAAKAVYSEPRYKHRGEFGELLLHATLMQTFETVSAITKIYWKDSSNENAKGFDAVHVREVNGELELWLGEAKFYSDFGGALSAVVDSLEKHSEIDFMRDEFLFVAGKLEDDLPQRERLQKLLEPNTSLDEVFSCAVFPCLMTYDSAVIREHSELSSAYREELAAELEECHKKLCEKGYPTKLRVHLLLVPVESKHQLAAELDERLKHFQAI